MNAELTCPTCGCTEFEYEEPDAGQDYTDDWDFTCAHCGRTVTRKALIEANRESIDATVEEMGDEFVKAAAKELEKSLKGLDIKVRL